MLVKTTLPPQYNNKSIKTGNLNVRIGAEIKLIGTSSIHLL